MRSASTASLVMLRQTLVARVAASVHAVRLSFRVEQAPAFHAMWDHSRMRRLSQPASIAQLVMLRQKLVARVVPSVHLVSFRIKAEEAPAFLAVWDHLQTRRLSQFATTVSLVSPQAKKAAPAAASVSLASFKTRESKRRAKHASVVSFAKVQTKLQSHAKQERTPTALDPCRAFRALQDRLRVYQEV